VSYSERGHRVKLVLFSFLVLLLVASAPGRSGGDGFAVQVKNPAAFSRALETIVVDLNREMGRQAMAVAVYEHDEQRVSQAIDLDGNGAPDRLVWQSAFEANQTKTFEVRYGVESKGIASLVDARFVRPREDIAWENDRIAFRIYGPALASEVNSGIDVWCKRVRYLIVEKWYKANEGNAGGKDSYHEDHGEGADFFSVGRTLGAGGSGLWSHDSVVQPGVFTTYKILATGPIRALFKVSYAHGTVDGKKYVEEKTYTLDAGENFNRIDVVYPDLQRSGVITVAAGIVKRKNTVPIVLDKECAVGLWGPTTDDPVNESLGTGIVVPRASFVTMKEDKNHYLILGKTTAKKPFTYFAGAGWTRSGDLKTQGDWEKTLAMLAARVANPLKVTVMKSSQQGPGK
jgi:pectinesterase